MLKVGILLFDGVDLLDVGGPYEVLLTAARLAERDGAEAPFAVTTLAADPSPVSAYGGLQLVPQGLLGPAHPVDVLIVPGTIAPEEVLRDQVVMGALRDAAEAASLVASVCTGAFLLAELGLLQDRPWTTHWEDVDALADRVPSEGRPWVRWVDAGRVITSGGLSSGIAMALHLVDRLVSRELARRTATQLEYDWDPDAGFDAG